MTSRFTAYRFLGRSACAVGAILLIVLTWISYHIFAAQQEREGWVRHTYVVLDTTTQVGSSLRAVLATSRGYLLAPGPRFLEVWKPAAADVKRLISDLQTLTSDNPNQKGPTAKLERASDRVLATVNEIAARGGHVHTSGTVDSAVAALVERSRDEMDAFVAIQNAIISTEQRLLEERLARANELLVVSKRWAALMGCAAIVTLLGAFLLIERQLFLRSRLEQSLETRVDERTRELALANHDLESFSYSIAHDLKSPMRAIEGFASLGHMRLGKGQVDAALTYLAKISDHAARTGQLVESLLIFSQIGRGALSSVPVDLRRIALGVWEELEVEREQRGSTSSLIIEEGLPIVLGEEPLLHQVMQNLMTNAIKYSAVKAGSTITVGCRRAVPPELTSTGPCPPRSDKEDHIFYVRDQGIGFDMSDYSRLFSVFQRLHTDHADGSGVGLAICKRIVERHGGCIWATSVQDEGTEICFTLRVLQRRDAAKVSQRMVVPPRMPASANDQPLV